MLRAGVVGVGNMGKNHARAYSELENVNLVAVADIDINVAEAVAKEFSCGAYKDYNRMLASEDLDIVSIAVPTKLHAKVAIDTIDAKVHTLVEKPISDNLEDAKKIIRAAKENGVKLAVGHIERFNPAVAELKRIIVSGGLGKTSSILAKRVGYFPTSPVSVNVIIEAGVHDIDIFNYILDKLPVGVYAHGGKAGSGEFKEDYANVLLDYGDVGALLEVNWITPLKIRRLEVTGSLAFAELDYISQNLVVHRNKVPHAEKIIIQKQEPLRLELEHFSECITNDKTPLNDGESAYNALEIAHKAVESLNKKA